MLLACKHDVSGRLSVTTRRFFREQFTLLVRSREDSNQIEGTGTDPIGGRRALNKVYRQSSGRSVQGAAAAALHEDLRYKPSLSGNFWKRSERALLSRLILDTPRGNDIAYANIIAAIGSGVVINLAHPGQENFTRPGAWRLAGMNIVGFAEGNLWNEFKPDLKHLVRSKILRKQ